MNTNNTSAVPVIGRILLAAIFVMSGIGKLMAPAAAIGYIQAMGLPLAGAGQAGRVGRVSEA
ncbi:DoxX family membrane protein ['Massilia aquatica' Lu et al. 2020]|uniref:DoxX family membrane protein n=1 Tax=Pseudoduganella aquatica TaxID=2660641 RepID=A0A7X4KKT6_9BURK|nr:DoxX family membrane protein [Pseudoduganella aquatica]MYN06055.1 DoxX family membrane protein [Pseudoduganella aquatica]